MASQVPATSGRAGSGAGGGAGGGGGEGRVQYVTDRTAAPAAPPRKFRVGVPSGQDRRDDEDDDADAEGVVSSVLRRYLPQGLFIYGFGGSVQRAGCPVGGRGGVHNRFCSGAHATDACAHACMRAHTLC